MPNDATAAPPEQDAEPARPHLLVWQDRLNASPGYRALALMEYVRRISYVFQANLRDYKTLVAQLQDPAFALPIFAVGNPRAHDDLLTEAERLLHNVLMAISTRIDQQRAFMQRHFTDDAQLAAEYNAGVKSRFGAYPPADFVRDLRNYLTHHRLPVAQSRQEFSSTFYKVTFVLARKPLLEWKKWKASARAWLVAQGGGDIEIVEILDGYAQIAGEFDKWLYDRIGAQFAEEISAYHTEAEAFDREWDRAFGFGTA